MVQRRRKVPRSWCLGTSELRCLDTTEPADNGTMLAGELAVSADRKNVSIIVGVVGISDGVPANHQATTKPLSSLFCKNVSLSKIQKVQIQNSLLEKSG